jgi:hypothetical protein
LFLGSEETGRAAFDHGYRGRVNSPLTGQALRQPLPRRITEHTCARHDDGPGQCEHV